MILPRNLNYETLIKKLSKLGYEISRQNGCHIRLITTSGGKHSITIPAHDPIKIGTLNSIIIDIASHFKYSKSELIGILFEA
jgi:predicted RNA binding protein YcfA (HicA-like mRNA interferase family)